MTCTGGRLAACLEWKINRPSPVMSDVLPAKMITGLPTAMTPETPNNSPWYTSWELINARAWWMLERSSEVAPQLSLRYSEVGAQRFRFWNDAMGFGAGDPTTLTVFEPWADSDQRTCIVREAQWLRDPDLQSLCHESKKLGKTLYMEPKFSVRDGEVPRDRFAQHLHAIASINIPAISIDNGGSASTDVGSCGFEFLSKDHPTASIRLKWSLDTPAAWSPIIDEVYRIRDWLQTCLQ